MAASDQIRVVLESSGLTIEDFAARLDEPSQRIKDVLRNKQRAPEDLLAKLVERFHIDATWLLTGFKPVPPNTLNSDSAAYDAGLQPDERALLDNYRHATEDGRKALRAVGAALAKPINPSIDVGGNA